MSQWAFNALARFLRRFQGSMTMYDQPIREQCFTFQRLLEGTWASSGPGCPWTPLHTERFQSDST